MVRRIACVAAVLAIQALRLFGEPAASQPATSQPAATAPASALYTELMTTYMDGRWDVLEKLMKDKAREVSALSTTEQVDVSAIRLALKEARQDWWPTTKTGTKGQITVSLWGRSFPVMFDPKTKYGANISIKAAVKTLNAGWAPGDMDSTEKTSYGVTKGDVAYLTAFSVLGNLESASQLPALTKDNTISQDRFLEVRGKLTGMVYGTPGSRRYGMCVCLTNYDEASSKLQIRSARRAIAAMFIGELLTHPENYPSIKLPKTVAAEKAEEELCTALLGILSKTPLTYAEDNALRTALKQLAGANGIKSYNAAAITLPNKLTVSLDPRTDADPMAERNTWIKQTLEKPTPAN